MEYRWLTPDEVEDLVNEVCQRQGWMQLNVNEARPTCRVLGAFDGVCLVGFLALQMTPVLGPAWVDVDHRDGVASRELADRMHAFLSEVDCRGALTICESAVSERLAKRHGMQPVTAPVYQWLGGS